MLYIFTIRHDTPIFSTYSRYISDFWNPIWILVAWYISDTQHLKHYFHGRAFHVINHEWIWLLSPSFKKVCNFTAILWWIISQPPCKLPTILRQLHDTFQLSTLPCTSLLPAEHPLVILDTRHFCMMSEVDYGRFHNSMRTLHNYFW